MAQLAERLKGALAGRSGEEASPLDAMAISALVKDVVLFGQKDLSGVLAAHGISVAQLLELSDTPVFKVELDHLRRQMKDDPHATLRMTAKQGLEMQMVNLVAIADDPRQPTPDRLKSIELLAKLADALPKASKQDAPSLPTLTINFGDFPPVNPRIVSGQ